MAGFVNTLAGGGSLITLPLLIFLGLPASVANGTNRVAILLQNGVALGSFRQSNVLDARGVAILGIPAVLGSVVGAQATVTIDEDLFRRIIGGIMVLMLVLMIARPQRWLEGELTHFTGQLNLKHLLLFFAIGFYGGFIQAGVGIFLLAALVLGIGYDLVSATEAKVGIIFLLTVAALLVFVGNGKVNWGIGLVLAIGNMLGAWVAARFAVEKGAVWVHRLVVGILALAAASLLGLFSLASDLIQQTSTLRWYSNHIFFRSRTAPILLGALQ